MHMFFNSYVWEVPRSKDKILALRNSYSATVNRDNAQRYHLGFSSLLPINLAVRLTWTCFHYRCPGSRDGRSPVRMAVPAEPPSLKPWTASCHQLVQLTNLCVCLFRMSTKLAVCVLCNAAHLPATADVWARNAGICPRAAFPSHKVKFLSQMVFFFPIEKYIY